MFSHTGKLNSMAVLLGLGLVMVIILTKFAPANAQQTPPPHLFRENTPYLFSQQNQIIDTTQTMQRTETLSWSKVAFQSYRDGNWNIYIGNDNDTGQVRLTSSGSPEIQPHINRGNTKIVFTRKTSNYDIIKMNVDGSNQVALTSNNTDDGNPAWSPDGTKIVFEAYRDGQAEIYVMNADGTGQTRLTTHGDYDGMPTWSPDGTKIAFVSRRTGGYRIWVMNADGTNQMQISTQPYSLHPQWSPDKTQIAFDADSDGDGWQELWQMNADGSNQSVVFDPRGTTDVRTGSWSPDGRYIAFTQVSFIQYQGNWYWTDAYLDAWDTWYSHTIRLSQNNRDWTTRWQTSDITAPVSQVNNLPAQSPGPIPISWSGTDVGGSGIASYDVQVKTGENDTWTNWLEGTSSTNDQYPGTGGNTYYFRVRSHDRAYNAENWPNLYDVSTTVENLPPESEIVDLSPYTRYTTDLIVNWNSNDPGGSGIAHYDVEYRVNNGEWTGWQSETTAISATLANTQPGETIDFRVRATDRAQNVEAWQNQADAQTKIYRWGITGTVYDNTHTPIGEAQAETSPAAIGVLPSDAEGFYGSYVASNSSLYTVTWNMNDYTSLPQTPFSPEQDKFLEVILPPMNNTVSNWGFESGSLAPDWTVGGTAPPFITNTVQHTGQSALWVGDTQPMVLESIAGGKSMAVDANGRVHIVWVNDNIFSSEIYYIHQLDNGDWTTPEIIPGTDGMNFPQIAASPDGKIHVFGVLQITAGPDALYHIARTIDGNWSTPVRVSQDILNYAISIYYITINFDESGSVYLAWTQQVSNRGTYCGEDAYFAEQSQDGVWSAPQNLTNQVDCSDTFNINSLSDESVPDNGLKMVISDENVYLLWNHGRLENGRAGFYYFQRLSNGDWLPFETITTNPVPFHFTPRIDMEVDSENNVHVVWVNSPENEVKYVKRNGAAWTAPILLGANAARDAQLEIDNTDTLHVVWWTWDSKFMYAVQSDNNIWTITQATRYASTYVPNMSLLVDNEDNLHYMWTTEENGEQTICYTVKKPVDQWDAFHVIYQATEDYAPAIYPTVDSAGNMHTLLQRFTSPRSYLYYGPSVTEVSSTASFSQTITVPVTMTSPVLSFMYQLGGMDLAGNSSFAVQINGSDNLIMKRRANAAAWTHEWVDLSNWAGETIDLSFNLNQAANANRVWGVIDEITVGSAFPDVWVAREDDAALPGSEAHHTISYGNRGGAAANSVTLTYTLPAEITFVSSSIPPSSVDPLVWDLGNLPSKSNPFEIEVVVHVASSAPGFSYLTSTAVISTMDELEMLNNQIEATTYTAMSSYLPIILR